MSDPATSDHEHTHQPDSTSRGRRAMRPLNLLFGACAVPQGLAASVLQDAHQAQPLPPSEDPWYTAPPSFESSVPGSILRIRPAPGNLTSVVKNAASAYHILYRTTDSRYRPSWAVTTLFSPQSYFVSPLGKAALLSYQFAYNSANLDSSPSIGLYWRLAQSNPHLGLKSDTSFLENLLSQGWIVNTPDYMGPDAAFGASVQAGHATLDSIRAVLNLANPTGIAGINVAIWGYSGGSIATAAAAELHEKYAPELPIAGTVLGGLVDDISADLAKLNESPIAGTVVAFLLGVSSHYPEAAAYLESRLLPATKDEFLSVRRINVADAVKIFAGRDIYQFFKGGASDLYAPVLVALYDAQTRLGHKGLPRMPMFMYKAIGDQYCPVDQTDATVKRWCGGGADITYERNKVGEHVSEIENGKPRALEWLWRIFDETYVSSAPGCSVSDVTIDRSAET